MEHKLIAFYEQRLDAPEQQEMEQWIAADPGHKKIYEEAVAIWKNAKPAPAFQFYDKAAAWQTLQQQIEATAPKRAGGRLVRWRQLTAVAAAAAFIGIFLWMNQPEPQVFTARQALRQIELSDKSQIVLFSNAELLVAADFNKANRTVSLKGNAFFDIAKNPDKPFVIHNGDVDIEVLGTSFTIQQGKRFNVLFVHSGTVKARFGKQTETAVAAQKIIKDNVTNRLSLAGVRADVDQVLKTRTIKVKDIRIDSLTRMLEELYQIQVVTAPELKERKITSTYLIGTETPDQIIEDIALTIDASWSKKEDQYTLTK